MSKKILPCDDIIKDLYLNKKLSSGDIANIYGCARGTVCTKLKKLGITRPESGVNSRNRNFHKKVKKSGYPVTFNPDHIRSNNIGYVFDHVLNMEKKIGKTPTNKTPIHHIDLDRGNSDIKNLYLCDGHGHHKRIHGQLQKVSAQLIKLGVICFDTEKGEYFVNSNAVTVDVVRMIAERL